MTFDLPPRWRFSKTLGAGGQAEVCLAHDRELDLWVAIKVFRTELKGVERQRLRREVRLGRELQHPGLVRVHELIEIGDRLGVVMEWVSGGSLSERAAGRPIEVDAVEDIARQTLEVLSYLHDNQIVHRDIKPSNLLIDDEGRVRLADLGLARPVADEAQVTRSHIAVGTPAYMAPEQIRGLEPTPASDLYALGATLYRLLTGEAPFKGDSDLDVAARHLTGRAPDARRLRPECPRWLARFVRRLMERDANDRWSDAGTALTAFDGRRGLLSPRLWRRFAAFAVSVLVVAVGGWIVVATVGDREVSSARRDGKDVVAVDSRGRELWRREVPGTSRRMLIADVTGDGAEDVVLGSYRSNEGSGKSASLVILDRSASEVANLEIANAVFRAYYPDFRAASRGVNLELADLDGDGLDEVVYYVPHSTWYPGVLGMWAKDWPERAQHVFVNSGHISSVRAADLDGDGSDELVAVVFNNLIGYQTVVAVVDPMPAARTPFLEVGFSPDLLAPWRQMRTTTSNSSLRSYTPLGPHRRVFDIIDAGPEGIVVEADDIRFELDVAGNPVGSVMLGTEPRLRNLFWGAVAQLCIEVEVGKGDVEGALEVLRTDHSAVLEEEPMRLALAMLVSRSLARAGRLHEAVATLEKASDRMRPTTDLWLRRAEYLAAAGRRNDAGAVVANGLQSPGNVRELIDPILLLGRIACLDGSERQQSVVRLAREYILTSSSVASSLETLASFCSGDWSSPALDDGGEARILPEAEVLRLWALWRRDGSNDALLERVRGHIANPEVSGLARLLEAAVLLEAGEVERAESLMRMARDQLEERGRTDFEHSMWLPLADRLLSKAAAAAGDSDQAKAHAERAARGAPEAWFGGAPG